MDQLTIIKLQLITTSKRINDIRNKSTEILVKELEAKYPDKFEFSFIPEEDIRFGMIEDMVDRMFAY